MSKPVVKETITALIKANPIGKKIINNEVSVKDAVDDIKQHIDRRLVGLVSKNETIKKLYSVPLTISFPNLTSQQSLEIESNTTLQDVLDTVFFMLDSEVRAFTYLEKWILQEKNTGVKLVIREIAYRIPATHIFTPSSKWEAIAIEKPYTATDSSNSIKRFRGEI